MNTCNKINLYNIVAQSHERQIIKIFFMNLVRLISRNNSHSINTPPILIVGEPNSGKKTMLQALKNHINQNTTTCLFTPASRLIFTKHHETHCNYALVKITSYKILMIVDIELAIYNTSQRTRLLHAIKSIREDQIAIFTTSISMSQLTEIDLELASYFKGCIQFNTTMLSQEEKLEIIHNHKESSLLPKSLITSILNLNIPIRYQNQIVDSCIKTIQRNPKKKELIKTLLNTNFHNEIQALMIRQRAPIPVTQRVLAATAHLFQITVDDLISANKTLSYPRSIVILILHDYVQLSYAMIGDILHKHYTSIIYLHKQMKLKLTSSETTITDLKTILAASLK